MSTRMYDGASLGEVLSAARRESGVSIDEASTATRVSPRVIEAFENDDYDAMPPRGYAQNMLSAYANYLGLDRRRIADLYADGFEDAARGAGSRGSTSYRRGRPIDVSTASWVDPNAGKRHPEPPRPSISDRSFEPRGRQARHAGTGRRPSDARRNGQAGEDSLHRLRHHSSLERPGIDDDRSPSAVTSYHHAGPSDPTRRMPRAGAGSASRRHPRAAWRDGRGRRPAQETESGSRPRANARGDASHRRPGTGGGQRRATGRQQERQDQGQGFGHGYGIMREREEARERQERSIVAHAKLLIPVFAAIVLVIIAIVLIATAGGHDSGETMEVTTASAASAAPAAATAPSQGATTASAAASYELTVSRGHTCTATITIDGTQAYQGTIVGPRTQSFSASRSVTFELSGTDGVTLAKDGTQVNLAADASGTATYEETLADNGR